MIKCYEFSEITILSDPHQRLRCTKCGTEYYNVVDEHPTYYYINSDGKTVREGKLKMHLELTPRLYRQSVERSCNVDNI